jgi:hypothetical protein
MWTSSPRNQEMLTRLWAESREKKAPIYIFYSVVKSGRFCGVAKMKSDIEPHNSLRYWWEENKYFGSFKIKWLFIKDVFDKKFNNLKENGTLV